MGKYGKCTQVGWELNALKAAARACEIISCLVFQPRVNRVLLKVFLEMEGEMGVRLKHMSPASVFH